MDKETIITRLRELREEFTKLEGQRLNAVKFVQSVVEQQTRLQGAFAELNKLLPEGERLTEASFAEKPKEEKK